MRNLPASFFTPPQNGGSKSPSCHSRENSIDGSLADPYSPAASMQNVGSPGNPGNPGNNPGAVPGGPPQAPPQHNRAHSSPATLQQTLAAAGGGNPGIQSNSLHVQAVHNHHRQTSYDVGQMGDNMGPLPPGWEATKTPSGQIYFMNHITKTTQWEDPRIQMQQQATLDSQAHQQAQAHLMQQQPSGAGNNLAPLPQGWEQGVTRDGEVYFINHNTKKTTWYDPRIPPSQQTVPIRVNQGPPPQIQQQQPPQQPNQQQQVLPQISMNNLSQPHRLRLQKLEMEKRELQAKQAELKRLDLARRQQQQVLATRNTTSAEMQITQEMLMRQSLNETNNDPFLTSTEQAEIHNRQASADSGLGMGSNFNLGSIPEDISGMESMDTGDLDTTLTGESNAGGQAGSGQDPAQLMSTNLPDLPNDLIEMLPGGSASAAPTGSGGADNLTWL